MLIPAGPNVYNLDALMKIVIFRIFPATTMAPPTTKFTLSSLVWASQKGYPPWPAVITASHLTGHWALGKGSRRKYHCTFLAWNKEWCWLERDSLKTFTRELGESRRKKCMVKNSKIALALVQAIELGLKILKDPKNMTNYLVIEEESEVVDEMEEKFVEGLLREERGDKVYAKRVVGSEATVEEMFVDSIIEAVGEEEEDLLSNHVH